MLVHCLLYVPTISIANSIAFANMKDAQSEFGIVRMGGTIGWILAAWPFTFILVDWDKVRAANPQGFVDWLGTVLSSGLVGDALRAGARWTFVVAGIASLLLAAFSLTLPHTPPKKAEGGAVEKLAWLEALKLLKHPFILVLWLVTFVDSFVHNCYFNWAGVFLGTPKDAGGVGIAGNWIMPVMSIGQIAEILTMFILGATLKRLGWRATMIVGILGYPARFAVWAFLPEHTELIILVQVLHGICYAFFFATVYIFVDAYFPKDVRSSAQGLFNVMILGVGALVANSICPWLLQEVFTKNGVTDFQGLFLVPLVGGLGGRGRARAVLPSAGEGASGLRRTGRRPSRVTRHLRHQLDLDAGAARDLGHAERAARVGAALPEHRHEQLRGAVGHEVVLGERRARCSRGRGA